MKETYLKKEFKTSDVKRMRNLITKNFSDSTKTQFGYEINKNNIEGEIFEENGKKYTISKGIKVSVPKFRRQDIIIPNFCPNCNKPLKDINDSKMYRIHKKCFNCVIEYETNLKIQGKYLEYEKEMLLSNFESYIKQFQSEFFEFLNSNETILTEIGDIETWNNNIDKEKIYLEFIEYIDKIKQEAKTII